jgi:hypothetical protein
MRAHYFKVMLVIVVAFVPLISQGCMRINFIGEGREEKEKRSGAVQPKGLLDEEPRKDIQEGVSLEIRFAGITYRGDLAFNVEINSRSAKLGQYPLDKDSTLANDRGPQVQATKWEIWLLTDHQVFGTIYFPAKDASGSPLLAQGVRNVTLKIEKLAGIPERVFQWDVASGSAGGKAIEKIFWADNDGEMHVSFPALWRAIKNNLRQIQ